MVIGNGMIARRFCSLAQNDEVILFASGVSNSKETRSEPFIRERKLVEHWLHQARGRLFVYFSTCSVNDPTERNSPYVAHKLALESLIAERADRYLICPASNVVGGTGNPNTVLNYFMARCRSGEPFDVWQGATRNLIDVDDLYQVVMQLIEEPVFHNQVINVAYPVSISPLQIVQSIERFTGRPAHYRLIDKGQPFRIIASECAAILESFGKLIDPERYLNALLHTYYQWAFEPCLV